MKKIKLTQSKYALVDDTDFEWLNQWKWYVVGKDHLYAQRRIGKKRIKMHRLIMKFPVKKVIDHIDGNGLNNQKSNLRVCTHSENLKNRKLPKNNTSGYKGVSFRKNRGKWMVRIDTTLPNGEKIIYTKLFLSKEKAVLNYNKVVTVYHGEFAKPNDHIQKKLQNRTS